MWIRNLPSDYSDKSSSFFNNVFLWQSENVFVMDNHMAALWCWLQVCSQKKSYNFMHIDRHYDLLDSFKDEDLEPLRTNPIITFDDFTNLTRHDKRTPLFQWANYIMAGYILHPRWFHTNIFLTCRDGAKEVNAWGHKPLRIREGNPLDMEGYILQFIGEPSAYLDGFKGNDYRLPWIVNLDLDVFYTGNSHIQLFSDDYIRRIAEVLNNHRSRIAVLTIAISPECLGGEDLSKKWENGFRILRIMSENLECLQGFFSEYSAIRSIHQGVGKVPR